MNLEDIKNRLKYRITEDIPDFIKIEILESIFKEIKKTFNSAPRVILSFLLVFLIFFNSKGDVFYAIIFLILIILFFFSWRYSIGEFRYIARERKKKRLLEEYNKKKPLEESNHH